MIPMPTGSPFKQNKQPMGPMITPQTMNSAAQGGQQNPAYLQMRTPMAPGAAATNPVITPKPMAPGDTVRPRLPSGFSTNAGPQITPASPPQRGGNTLGDVYNFMKSDLQNQTKNAKSNAIADASARGVYYGTPLTGSEADIDTQYLRGLGQLDAGMYGNEQQNQLARLGMATNLSAQGAMNAPQSPEGMDWSGLGALFGSGNQSVAASRPGPVISPPITKSGEGASPVKKKPQID